MIAIDTQGRPYELEIIGADGRPLASSMQAGQVGRSAETWVPSERDQHRELLPTANGPIDLILRTGYFTTGNRIKRTEISIGRSSDLGHSLERSRQNRLILIGVCIVMGFYHLGLYLLRRGERAPLYFALLSILFAIRHFFRFDLFEDRFPGLDAYPLHAAVEYSTFFFGVAFFIAFLRSLFPLDLPLVAVRGVAAVASICSLLVFLPLRLGEGVLSFFEFFTIIVIILAAILMVRAIIFRRDPQVTAILGIGIAVLLVVTFHDILYNLRVISSAPLEHLGVFSFIFAQAMVLALLNMRSRKQAEDLARSLRRLVPGEFSQILGKQDITNVELGDSVLSEMTVLFCDIRGFTGLSERNEVGEVFSLLNAIYARLVPLIREHGGFIDKYIGDAIMAIFPASPVESVRASIAIFEATRSIQLPSELAQTTTLSRHLAVGIGIHSGSVMLGMIGEQQRMEATVIADVVNVASRLEGLSKHFGAGILISGELYRALASEDSGDERIARETRSLGRVRLAGKRQSVEVYEVFVGDQAELRAVKRAGLADFAAALAHFEAGDFAAAKAGFSSLCTEKNRACTEDGEPLVDQPAAIYAAASAELLLSPPEDEWQGILEIHGK
ncbi:MAG TPA: adenylate/guanylate cyclase domain-containing protein [Nannocystis exedens]|nr:adenylate/guanylate cyclase domain-containing protein [Nannocystis exedens]